MLQRGFYSLQEKKLCDHTLFHTSQSETLDDQWGTYNDEGMTCRVAKQASSQKIQGFFHVPINFRCMWQGIQTIPDYKGAPLPSEDYSTFLNKLNKYI